jgi:thiol-disulfide isomerase/thioredoxin
MGGLWKEYCCGLYDLTYYTMIKSIHQLLLKICICLPAAFILVVSFKSDNNIHFIEDKNLKTFEQVIRLNQFKDKVIYVDLWGTRCIPCIEEFAFNNELKEKFKDQPVEYLYLAVDYGHPDDYSRWKEMVQDKKLFGYNMLISASLYKEVWNIIKDSVKEMYLIPHYIIVDKKGKIVYADAARPSAKDSVYRELQAALKGKTAL